MPRKSRRLREVEAKRKKGATQAREEIRVYKQQRQDDEKKIESS